MPALKLGAVGVTELVGGDPQRRLARGGEAGGGDRLLEPAAQPEAGQAPAALHEQKVGRAAVARVRQGALRAALGHPGVHGHQGLGVQGDHPLGAELAERHLDPGAMAGRVPQAVELQVQQLAKAHAGAAQDRQPAAGEQVVEATDGRHEVAVDLGRQRPG